MIEDLEDPTECVKCNQRQAVVLFNGAAVCPECLAKAQRLEIEERHIAHAIATQYVLAFIVFIALLGMGFFFLGWKALAVVAGAVLIWAVIERGRDG